MRVTMLKEEKGSPNGIRVEKYLANESYDMPERLANVFIDIGSAREAGRLRKNAGNAPENKVVTPEVVPAPEVENNKDKPEEKDDKKKKKKKDKPPRREY